jgi:hypothetical protein
MKKYRIELVFAAALAAVSFLSCEELDDNVLKHTEDRKEEAITLDDLARLLSSVPIGASQMEEVSRAVNTSTANGYDEEYTMKNVFASPGTGVGEEITKSEPVVYDRPLKDLIAEAVRERYSTRSSEGGSAEEYLASLSDSDMQIYWPYSDEWDGESLPVITYDPLDGASKNVGYTLSGEEIVVSEEYARKNPVWVVNFNEDASYKTIEMLRREDPDWGSGGGTISVKSEKDFKTLILRSFRATRPYDSWLSGASEFFVKCGSIEGFNARTEAGIAVYSPTVSDFMIVVRRNQVDKVMPFNAIIVSEWTDNLSSCAFIITEDDGGSRTTWKCSATVKYNSKNYGFDLEIPLNTRDDIVWRGQLTRNFVEKYSGRTLRFGDVSLVLELI